MIFTNSELVFIYILMDGNNDIDGKLRNPLMTQKLPSPFSSLTLSLDKFLMNWVRDLEPERGFPVQTLHTAA